MCLFVSKFSGIIYLQICRSFPFAAIARYQSERETDKLYEKRCVGIAGRRDVGLMDKRIADSRVEQVYQIRPEHLNGANRLFGGRLMEWIDEVAGLVGIRHCHCNVITASVDNLKFIRGVFQNELIVLIGSVIYVGNTSMEIRVDTYVESLDGMRYPVNRAYVTLVAVDLDGKPVKVPGLIRETVGEEAEWEAGKKRRELRMLRRKEGF